MSDVQKLDPDDPRPQYVQVADAIRSGVASGAIRPGERLPSHADVAAGYGVSVGTVKRAFGLLQDEGVIVSRQGQPAHVRVLPDDRSAAHSDLDPSDVRAALVALDRRLAAVERQLDERAR